MTRENRKRVLWMLVASATLCSNGVTWAKPLSKKAVEKTFPQANVMVEATVVRLAAKDYYGLGISPIGLTHPSVVMEKLAAHIGKSPELIVAGMKGSPSNHQAMDAEEKRHVYVKRLKEGETAYSAYSSGKDFAVDVKSRRDKTLVVEFSLQYSWFDHDGQPQGPPPNTHTWSWQGMINMTPGQPVIGGSHLDDKHVVVLILTSHLLE